MSELQDLRDRLERAAIVLDETVPGYWEAIERARVRGKAEGVRLAMSYVDEALRVEATR